MSFPPSQKEILQALQALSKSKNLPESQRIVEVHANLLLTDVADQLLRMLIQQYAGDANATRMLEQHRTLLQHCRRQGIENTFAALARPKNMTDELSAILQAISHSPHSLAEMPQRVELCQRALALIDSHKMPKLWALLQCGLAESLLDNPLEDPAENQERAIECYRKALEVATREAMPAEWADHMISLGVVYRKRFLGNPAENQERAIECYRKALEVTTREAMPAKWARNITNLGNAYRDRIYEDPAENQERAIECYRKALEVRTREAMPAKWATTMKNLGIAYFMRIREDRVENLERAIECSEQAHEVATREAMPVDWAEIMWELGNAYCNRIREDRAENQERAIECYRKAFEVMTREAMPENWAKIMISLGAAYFMRIREDRAENLERAIECLEQARKVAMRETMPVQWAQSMVNQGSVYYQRIREDRAENLERAIECYRKALEVMTREFMPVQWAQIMTNLGAAYWHRIREDRAENLERAIECYRKALEVMTREAMPDDHQSVQMNLGDVYIDLKRWRNAAEALQKALDAGNFLYITATTPEARRIQLRKMRNLPENFAYSVFKAGIIPKLSEAVISLERNRARWLSETLALSREKPDLVPEATWQTFEVCRTAVQELLAEERLLEDNLSRRDYLTFSQDMKAAYTKLNNAITAVRQHDNGFMPNPSFEEIQEAVTPLKPTDMTGVALVYFAMTSTGSVAFVVKGRLPDDSKMGAEDIICVPLNELSDEMVTERFVKYFILYGGWKMAQHYDQALKDWLSTIDDTMHWLWDTMMGPLTAYLKGAGIRQAVLVPQGLLGFLPLHAACNETGGSRCYAMDDVCYTYAPNATALRAAKRAETSSPSLKLLAVDEPLPVSAPPLPFSELEVSSACAYFKTQEILGGRAADKESVRNALPRYNVLHLSCHSRVSFESPQQSGLLMAHDTILTLADMLSMRLKKVRLAVLSACETGTLDIDLPNEAVGLPAGMLQAGVAGVVASLWSVSDFSTAILMTRFYDLWRGDEGHQPAVALNAAQKWFRDTSTNDKIDEFRGMSAKFSNKPAAQYAIEHLIDSLKTISNDGEIDFSHPFYWAGFSYTGV